MDRGGGCQDFVQRFHYVRFQYADRQDEDRSYLRSPPANQLSPSLPSFSSSSSSLGTEGRGGVIEDRDANRLLPLGYDGNEDHRLDRSVIHIPRLARIATAIAPLTNTTHAWRIGPAPDGYWLFPVRHDLVAPKVVKLISSSCAGGIT